MEVYINDMITKSVQATKLVAHLGENYQLL